MRKINRKPFWIGLVCLLTMAGIVAAGFVWLYPLFSQPQSSPVPPVDYSAEYAEKWCYRQLSERQQENYAAVYAAIREGFGKDTSVTLENSVNKESSVTALGETVTLPQPLAEAPEIQRLYSAVLRDNPSFFYVGSTYSYQGYRTGNVTKYNTLYLTYTMNAAERAAAQTELEASVARYVSATASLKTQYEKELWLHDMLLNSCSYNKKAAESSSPLTEYPNDFTAYGALVKGEAVCEGYANAMQLLLSHVGITSTSVSGFDEKHNPHMWNLVEIDGGRYYLDATWNDLSPYFSRLYFNMNTEDLLRTHKLDRDNFGLDEYTDTSANYFVRSGRFVDDYDRETIAALVAEAVTAGETCIQLRFAEDKYTNALLFVNNEEWFSSMVEEKMNGTFLWEFGYSTAPEYHTIAIYKKS